MDSVRQWAFGICAAAIACALAQLILPKSSMQRVFNITCGVFFLGCLLSPVVLPSAAVELTPPESIQRQIEEKAGRLESAVEEGAQERATESVRLEAMRALRDMGVSYNKIYINVHDDGQGGISISECEVELDRSYLPRHDEIRAALTERLGVRVLIGYDDKGVTS